MEQTRLCAGIYIADDKTLVGVLADRNRKTDLSDFSEAKLDALAPLPDSAETKLDFSESLEAGMRRIVEIASELDHGPLDRLAIAVPGPVKVSGVRLGELNRETLRSEYGTFGAEMRREEFAYVDIRKEFNALKKKFAKRHPRLIHNSLELYVYHDAAAYAYGDYCIRKREFLIQNSNTTSRQYDRSETHALILADEGVGGAIIAEGMVAQGPTHAEMGHICVQRHPGDLSFGAYCPVHKRTGCLEGLVSIPALKARWGEDVLERTKDGFSTWDEKDGRLWLIAYYIAQLVVSLVLIIAPSHISLAGRIVNANPLLVKMIRGYYVRLLETSNEIPGIYPGYSQQIRPETFISANPDRDVGTFGAIMLGRNSDKVARVLAASDYMRGKD